ncbi:hypothetical protein ACF07D_01120 [Leucobacter sp. NPDC015123]|uniref:hypothetical protein n=1 Tax=Leucobacter sp. NPDC015123 TaxID=3364129 RepID=UPI0036F4A515
MTRMTGQTLGLGSLRLDAAYCLILGVAVAAAAGKIAGVIALPESLLFATGGIVVVWAGLVFWMAGRVPMKIALRVVMGVNIVATALIAAASVTAASWFVVAVVLAIAIEVGLFAVSQAVAIRRLAATDAGSRLA